MKVFKRATTTRFIVCISTIFLKKHIRKYVRFSRVNRHGETYNATKWNG